MAGPAAGIAALEGTLRTPCSLCGAMVRPSAVLHTADALPACSVCYTKADVAATRRRATGVGSRAGVVGVIASIVPLLVHSTSARVVSGTLANGGYRDWIALGCGSLAAGCGVGAIVTARARASGRWLAIGALAVVLGGYHVARSLGFVG
jgi:hypothetical protein